MRLSSFQFTLSERKTRYGLAKDVTFKKYLRRERCCLAEGRRISVNGIGTVVVGSVTDAGGIVITGLVFESVGIESLLL